MSRVSGRRQANVSDDDTMQRKARARAEMAKSMLRTWAEPEAARIARGGPMGATPALLAPQCALFVLEYVAELEAQLARRLVLPPAEPQPDAPTDIARLPDYWDERRRKQGKPDLSRCAAELRIALAAKADR
jgi:hypothetical protein